MSIGFMVAARVADWRAATAPRPADPCVLRRETPTRTSPTVQATRCLGRNGGRGGDDRGSGSRGTLGRKTRQHCET